MFFGQLVGRRVCLAERSSANDIEGFEVPNGTARAGWGAFVLSDDVAVGNVMTGQRPGEFDGQYVLECRTDR